MATILIESDDGELPSASAVLQVRATNANYNQPASVVNVASPAFGSITSAGRAREMQFGIRLEF